MRARDLVIPPVPSRIIWLVHRTIWDLPSGSTITNENLGMGADITAIPHSSSSYLSQPDQPPMWRFASKSMSRAVRGEVGAVSVAQAGKRTDSGDAKGLPSGFTQRGTDTQHTIVIEADEPLVESCVP